MLHKMLKRHIAIVGINLKEKIFTLLHLANVIANSVEHYQCVNTDWRNTICSVYLEG